jgi:hypothetical protein
MIIVSLCLSLIFGTIAFICFYFKILPYFVSQDTAFWLTLGFFSFGAFLVSFNKLLRFFGYWLEIIRHEEKKNKKE